jgi:hypothetical protein
VIGNDSYRSVSTLDNARSDARSMAKALEATGFKVSLQLDLTERGMKEALRNFRAEIQGGDEVVLFFAGHGVQIGAANYLLPVDIRGQSEEQVKDEAIALQRVLDDFFYVPLVLLGAPPLAVFIAVELNHASQLWCHTEVIGRIPFLDRFLNTPSNHRVHHARDRAFADSAPIVGLWHSGGVPPSVHPLNHAAGGWGWARGRSANKI